MRWRLFWVSVMLLATSPPALAHKLKVFATVEAQQVHGYAFFVGGGRARGTSWTAFVDDQQVASGKTDAEGQYAFDLKTAPRGAVVVKVDTQEGHMASISLNASRFAMMTDNVPVAASVNLDVVDIETAQPDRTASADASIDAIEAAVQRQVTPLLERIEELDARLRVTDILSGVFLIIGLAGLWYGVRRGRP